MRWTRRTVILGLVSAALAVVVLRLGWLAVVRDRARVVTGPIERAAGEGTEALLGPIRSFFQIGELTKQVRSLEGESARLRAENARLRSVEQENTELRGALRLLPQVTPAPVLADVVGPTTDGVTTAVRINRGARDGIRPRSPVLGSDGSVVGRVRDVAANTAEVDLLAGGTFRVAARATDTGAQGIVRGLRGLDVIIEGVPRTDELRAGDTLVTTGIDGVFPPHLFIGTIRSVRSPEHAIFQEASVRVSVDVHRLRLVAVLPPLSE